MGSLVASCMHTYTVQGETIGGWTMNTLIKHLKDKGWEGLWYLTILVALPAFIGIPTVLWLVKHSEKGGF